MYISHNDKIASVGKYGVSSPSRWEVKITSPRRLLNTDPRIENRLLLSCEQTDLPGRVFSTSELKIYSLDRKIPYGTFLEDISLTFRCSSDLAERKYFENWQGLIQNETTKNYGYYDDYVTEMEIVLYEKGLEPVYRMHLFEAYPFSVFPLALQQDSTGTYNRQTVGIKFKEWKQVEI
jgi:hypothetical protein